MRGLFFVQFPSSNNQNILPRLQDIKWFDIEKLPLGTKKESSGANTSKAKFYMGKNKRGGMGEARLGRYLLVLTVAFFMTSYRILG